MESEVFSPILNFRCLDLPRVFAVSRSALGPAAAAPQRACERIERLQQWRGVLLTLSSALHL